MKLRIYPIMLCLLAAAFSFTGCSDEEPAGGSLLDSDVAHVREAASTYNSLTFSWDKIEGVNQYGYTLRDLSGNVIDGGITDVTSVTFEELASDASYSFELQVFGSTGEPSYRSSITASTLAIRQLDTPKVTSQQEGNTIRLTWEPVEGAYAYRCTYAIGENDIELTTSDTSCLISGLAPGSHNVSVQALSDYGGYTDSEIGSVECVRTRTEIGTVTGTYTCGLMRRNNTWPCTMRIFDDNSYIIEAFYQGEGYNLDFYVDRDVSTGESFIGVYNFVEFPDAAYYVVETGRASVPQLNVLSGLVDGAYGSTWSVEGEHGTLTINTGYKDLTAADTFVW